MSQIRKIFFNGASGDPVVHVFVVRETYALTLKGKQQKVTVYYGTYGSGFQHELQEGLCLVRGSIHEILFQVKKHYI